MLIPITDRCPECDAIAYIRIHPKHNNDGQMITNNSPDQYGDELPPHVIGDGCYLDADGCLNIVRFDETTHSPDYVCLFCGWVA